MNMFDIFKPLSMRLASNDPWFALLIANEYVSAVNKSEQWIKHNGVDITGPEVEEFAQMVESMRFETALIDDGKVRFINDHLPKYVSENRIWFMQGEHNILSMRLAKPQLGMGEIFTAGAIKHAYLTNATVLKGDVVTTPRGIEIKDAGSQFIKKNHLATYIENDLDILAFMNVSNTVKAPGAPRPLIRSRYKMFRARDYENHMYVSGDAVKFIPFKEG
jgi:hypothetical protein